MAHTPGPWKVIKREPDYGTVNRFEIWAEHWPVKEANLLTTVTGRGYLSNKEVAANANLMASAPNLLTACKAAYEWLKNADISYANGVTYGPDGSEIRGGESHWEFHRELKKRLEDAIAKAEGSTQE